MSWSYAVCSVDDVAFLMHPWMVLYPFMISSASLGLSSQLFKISCVIFIRHPPLWSQRLSVTLVFPNLRDAASATYLISPPFSPG